MSGAKRTAAEPARRGVARCEQSVNWEETYYLNLIMHRFEYSMQGAALQRRGIPSQLLYLPDENHWVLKPKNSIVWHDTILAWLEKWLKK